MPGILSPYTTQRRYFFAQKKRRKIHTANERPVRIQYKCLVPIYVFPEMKLRGLVISKTEFEFSVSQFPHSFIFVQFMYYQDRFAYFAAAK
jgi:hypothetical protein